jgi:FkbM family methyltransferase
MAGMILSEFDEIFEEIKAESSHWTWEHISAILEQTKAPVALYGAGLGCKYAVDNCNARNIQIACICDSYETGYFEHKGICFPIISPTELVKSYSNALILVTPKLFREQIVDSLLKMGFSKEQIFTVGISTINPAIFSEKYFEGYKWAYGFFNDAVSKQRIIDNVKRYLCAKSIPADSSFDESYWAPPAIQFGKNEVFVDGGAYTGDTAESFIDRVKEYAYIYSFEPDPSNYEQAILNCKKYANIEVINKGLWNKETVLQFFSAQYFLQGSRIINKMSDNTIEIPVTSLDVFFAGKADNELPTLIKMDIEGAEKEALIGATEIIRKTKPKLIICAYHKPEDIYELPRAIMNIRDDYKFFLWHIGDNVLDLILYAY